MKPVALLEMLEDAATQLGVRVSYEQLATAGVGGTNHGGMCRVKGEYRVIIDKRATPQERLTTLAAALSRLDSAHLDLDTKVRELLTYHSQAPRALKRAS